MITFCPFCNKEVRYMTSNNYCFLECIYSGNHYFYCQYIINPNYEANFIKVNFNRNLLIIKKVNDKFDVRFTEYMTLEEIAKYGYKPALNIYSTIEPFEITERSINKFFNEESKRYNKLKLFI